MKKKELEITLEKLDGFRTPDIKLEQYTTPATVAAELLNIAYLRKDIYNKVIYDLGCGPGILGIGAALLGARKVVLVDMDEEAIKIAKENAEKFSLGNIVFNNSDIRKITGRADIVLQNPPFGVHWRRADRAFLEKALEIADVVYSMHKRETRDFIIKFVKGLGASELEILPVSFILPRSYKFHEKDRKTILVDIYRIRRN
ncbi:ribosomal protein L11 methyltransferase [archaeon BMS3Bbin15]|nr:ribosomal protein L11 methyltransferase [archaeon BMS3Bbin15]